MAAEGEMDAKALSENAAFMDKYSRQIGAYGIEAMSKLIQLKVRTSRNASIVFCLLEVSS
jgi:hypothetical protein